jgi:hypothetical protein
VIQTVILPIILGILASAGVVLAARVARPPKEQPVPHGQQDLTTISGLAEVLVRQGEQIEELQRQHAEHEAHARIQDLTIRALRRWATALQEALRSTGADVPDPHPEDVAYINGS